MWNFFKKNNNVITCENKEDVTEIKQDSLIEAVEKYDINLVKKLIDQGININEQNSYGDTALIVAVMLKSDKRVLDKNKKYKIVEYLLENGANVYQKNNYNYNIMKIMRGKKDYDDITKIFKKYGYVGTREPVEGTKGYQEKKDIENPNAYENKEDVTEIKQDSLIEAVEKYDINLVKKLIDQGININEQNNYGDTALIVAVMLKSDKRVLDKNKKLGTTSHKNALDSKLQNNKHKIVEYLLENGADVYQKNNYNYNIMEIMRGKKDYDDITKIFKEHGYVGTREPAEEIKGYQEKKDIENPNAYKSGATLLYHAILDKNVEQTKFLLKSGADINFINSDDISYDDTKLVWHRDRYKTPIEASVYAGDLDILKLLMEYNPNIDALFELAILEEKSEIVELLIKKGANFNIVKNEDEYEFVPLKSACEKQNLKIVKILIENGADTNIAGYEGRTALFDAIDATKANKEIISYLIKNGADIHKEDDRGITPLSFAQSSKKSLVKVLTEHEEVILSENQDLNIAENYQILSDNILRQNKVINKLKDEVNIIKNRDENNQIEELKLQINTFKESILSQLNEIKELQNKLILKEENTKNLIDDFTHKIRKLEKKFDRQKIVKTKIPIDIPVENHSIQKDDGVIVKRESFDDF